MQPSREATPQSIEIRPKTTYYLVTEGATTKNGGVIHVRKKAEYLTLRDKRVALVGDYVQYADGSTATIISGAGNSLIIDNTPIAIIQSTLDNGDIIEEAGILFKDCEICFFEDEPLPEGFLVNNWTLAKE